MTPLAWKREWQSTLVFLPGEFHGQRSLESYSPWGHKESDMTEQIIHTHTPMQLIRTLHVTPVAPSTAFQVNALILLALSQFKILYYTTANKGPSSQGYGFSVVMYGCESWTVKKAECQRIDAFELWFWRRLLRVDWTARRSSQSILKEIVLGVLWKD